jgi:hypothetical protein
MNQILCSYPTVSYKTLPFAIGEAFIFSSARVRMQSDGFPQVHELQQFIDNVLRYLIAALGC